MIGFVKSMACVIIGFTFLTAIAADNKITLKSFESNKILYDFDKVVELKAVVVNKSAEDQTLTVEAFIKKGVDQRIEVGKKEVTIPAGKEKELTFKWNSDHSEYGHAAFLELKDQKGETVTISKPVIFEVCHDWRKIIRQGSFPVYHNNFNPDSPLSSAKVLNHKVGLFRDWGYNIVEFFGPFQPEIDNLNPDEEVWPYCFAKSPVASKSKKNAKISKQKLKEWINGFHDAGIKVITYVHTPTYVIRDESWRLYDPATGKKIHYSADSKAQRKWFEEHGLGFPNSLKFCREYGEKIAESVKEYGWDGCFFDDFNTISKCTAKCVDKNGKTVTDLSEEELHSKGLELLTGPARKIKDNYLAVPNGLHHALCGIQLFPARDMFGKKGEKFPWLKSADQKCVFFGEWRAPLKQANSPWQLGRSLRAVREATGVPVFCLFTIGCPKPWEKCDAQFHGENAAYTYAVETVLPYTAVVLSNGIGYSEYYSSAPWGDLKNDPVAIARVSYIKFAARYGQYLYDLNIHWTPKGMVKVKGPDHVYWKGNTFERKFSDHREVYVHLINFDKMYLAAKLWDKTRKKPPTVSEIPVEIALNPGETEVEAFCVSADGNQEPKKVSVKIKDGKAEIIVPKLEYWDMLVARIKKDK